MKQTLYICITFFYLAFSQAQEQRDDDLERKILNYQKGIYTNKTNVLVINSIKKDSINIELIIANQQCAMPIFEGTLYKFSNNIYKGFVKPNIDAIENDSNNLTLKFSNHNIILKSDEAIENQKLGFYCWIDGLYTKK